MVTIIYNYTLVKIINSILYSICDLLINKNNYHLHCVCFISVYSEIRL
ncbi:hypothetical protein PPBDW_II0846 [Photobacterium kishitanii]|nr:hypothetical protein PPBDW_II0846 [Photobacterium kishitanii]